MKNICVIGLGYIGLPTAAMFARCGFQVTGVDINQKITQMIATGKAHIQEPGLAELVQQVVSNGRLRTQLIPEAADAFIIAVQTPFSENDTSVPGNNKRADMRFVISAAESILPYLQPGNLVVLESTSPPRTTVDLIVPILERSGLAAGRDFYLAYTPERVLPGQILKELVEDARVIGGIDAASARAGADLYRSFVQGEIIETDATTAEMVKLMENTSRDINIAIANEFSQLAERFGISIWEAIEIANKHPRIKILKPGPGVGGHCISVDPWFLVEAAPDDTPLIQAARLVNDSQPGHVIQSISDLVGELEGKQIALLGLAYKENVDDLRESPAVEIALKLVARNAIVKAYEPNKPDFHLPGASVYAEIAPVISTADLIVVLVRHQEVISLDPYDLAKITPARLVYDAIHAWDSAIWRQAGFDVRFLGASASNLPIHDNRRV